MTKLVFAALGLALAAPTFADTPLSFQRDGVTYVGTIRESHGVRYITGQEVGRNRTFALRVAGGWVTGTYDGDEVSYPEPVRLVAAR